MPAAPAPSAEPVMPVAAPLAALPAFAPVPVDLAGLPADNVLPVPQTAWEQGLPAEAFQAYAACNMTLWRAYAPVHGQGVSALDFTRVNISPMNAICAKTQVPTMPFLFRSVEHMKRYTTLGMAPDQGKTANVTALAIMGELTGRSVTETAATAQFVEHYAEVDDALLLHGDRRTDGILLEAMLEVFPNDDVLPKIVTGLLDGRVAGRWSSTQDNAWVLMALKRYFEVAEKVTPDFVAQVWLGSGYAGDHTFKGRTTERARIDVPSSRLHEKP